MSLRITIDRFDPIRSMPLALCADPTRANRWRNEVSRCIHA